jgi:hypothetical protein
MGLLSTIGTGVGAYFGGPTGAAIGGSLGGALEGGLSSAGGMQQSSAAQSAAQQAAQASQFRPVGITNTFGTSNFGYDPTTGQLTSAGYTLSPQLQAAQNTLMSNQTQNLQDLTNIQNLGRQYLAQSPQQAAQQYMANQQALLQPSRDLAQARLNTNLFNSGTGGLSVAQGGNLGMANPEQQALANANALQDLQLAAQAQQAGQQQVTFGTGLLSNAYQPYSTGLTALGATEGLGQQPLELSASLAGRSATAGANAGKYMTTPAYAYSPAGTLLSQLGSASSGILGNVFGNTTQGNWGWGGPSGQFESDINTSGFGL